LVRWLRYLDVELRLQLLSLLGLVAVMLHWRRLQVVKLLLLSLLVLLLLLVVPL
jgi:hypothetical protein